MRGHTLIQVGVAMLVVAALIGGGAMLNDDGAGSISPVGEAEAAAVTTGIAIGVVGGFVGCHFLCGGDGDEVDAADAEQARIDIFSSASGVHDQQESHLTSLNNYMQDSKEIALMEGKNAYIRALNNDSTQIQSEQAAVQAIEDYYSERQLSMRPTWNTSATHWEYLWNTAGNESLDPSFVHYGYSGHQNPDAEDYDVVYEGLTNKSVTLNNGTVVKFKAYDFASYYSTGSNPSYDPTVGPSNGSFQITGTSPATTIENLTVQGSYISSDYEQLEYLDYSEWKTRWDEIPTLSSDAQDEMVTFVQETYPDWEDGMINSSDLVDPYLGSREYSPDGNYEDWALRSHSSLGLDAPENLSTFGSMEIVTDSTQIEGILMSDGLPPGDTFEKGVTYNTNNLEGLQFVVGSAQTWELDGDFTITEMTNAEGVSMNETVYRNVTYETADLSEYQALQENMTELREEYEAMKQNAGGGWSLPSFGLGGLAGAAAIVALLLLVFGVLMVTKE